MSETTILLKGLNLEDKAISSLVKPQNFYWSINWQKNACAKRRTQGLITADYNIVFQIFFNKRDKWECTISRHVSILGEMHTCLGQLA